jgi:hypothetical protein
VPAVRDSDPNYSQVAREQKLTQEEQEPKSVSQGGFNHKQASERRKIASMIR